MEKEDIKTAGMSYIAKQLKEKQKELLKQRDRIVRTMREKMRATNINPEDPPFYAEAVAEVLMEIIDGEKKKILKEIGQTK